MAKTYDAIATTTLGSAQASYTFSSIPATYTDLILVSQSGLTASDYMVFQLNGDTATNYSYTTLNGDGTTVVTNRGSSTAHGRISWYTYTPVSTLNGMDVTHFMNYANTSTNKTVLARHSSGNGVELIASLWRSTAAINSIKIFGLAGNLYVGSTFTLYGIKAA